MGSPTMTAGHREVSRTGIGTNVSDRDVGPDSFHSHTENGVETSKFVQLPPNLKTKPTIPRQRTQQPNYLPAMLQFIGLTA